MKYELRLADEAVRSIEEQLAWYDQLEDGEPLGDRWLEHLTSALDTLADQPMKHGFAAENGRWRTDIEIRQMKFRPWKSKSMWRVLFVIDEEEHMVTVIQIRHASRPRMFEEENIDE